MHSKLRHDKFMMQFVRYASAKYLIHHCLGMRAVFFKNPIVSAAQANILQRNYAAAPYYSQVVNHNRMAK